MKSRKVIWFSENVFYTHYYRSVVMTDESIFVSNHIFQPKIQKKITMCFDNVITIIVLDFIKLLENFKSYNILPRCEKQNRESTKGYSRWKVEYRHGKFEESDLNNWSTSKSHNGGRNQVSGRVSVPCLHATPVANAPWKQLIIGEGQARYQCHVICGKSDWLGSHCWSRIRISFNIRERDTSYCWIRSPYRP